MKNKTNYLYFLIGIIYFVQGIKSLPSQPLFYYFKETLNMSASKIMYITSIVSLAWFIKPLWGFLSDNKPLFGYRRKSYIILSAVLGIICCLFIGLIPSLPIFLLIGFLILESLSGAVRDVAIDGISVEEGKVRNLTGAFQSVSWGSLTVATMFTGLVGGYIAEKWDYHIAFLLVILFLLGIIITTLYYQEPKRESSSLSLFFSLKALVSIFKNKQFLLSSIFLFCLWFSPAVGTPIMFKLRDELHLSKIYIGFLATVGSFFGIIGALIYWKISKKINLKKWLKIGIVISSISTWAYLFLNNISVVIYTIIFGISGMFIQLLIMDYMARICPSGSESTIFALLCSILNFSGFLSVLLGAKLYSIVGYNWLIIISGLFTFICLLFVKFLKINNDVKYSY
ncbi:hypothetical protein DRN69_08720 [Candidatus Pacearchaeota archaeon]|nr:MAG: hypothetical protein DRN69_08720 [Candidatus Pacearchaeota archaeon]